MDAQNLGAKTTAGTVYGVQGNVQTNSTKTFYGSKSQRTLTLDSVATETFRAKKSVLFFQKHSWKPILVKDADGKVQRYYVNIKEVAQKSGVEVKGLRAANKQELLESELASLKQADSIRESQVEQQKESNRLLKEKSLTLLGIDPSLPKKIQKDLPTIISFVEANLEKWDAELSAQKRANEANGKPGQGILVASRKLPGNLPYTVEYHGKNEKGDPLVYIRYHANFASGGFKKATKVLNPITSVILVKSTQKKYGDKSTFMLIDAKEEVAITKKLQKIEGVIRFRHDVTYEKNGKMHHAIYTDYQNLGTLNKAAQLNIPEEEIQQGMLSLLNTVKEMHDQGYMHYDIKGDNVLVSREKGPDGKFVYKFYLADLGLASRKQYGERSGTRPFLSPEQKNMRANPDGKKSDVWQLGCTFEELLNIRRAGSPLDEIMGTSTEFNPLKKPTKIETLDDVIAMMRQENQSQRWTIDQAIEGMKQVMAKPKKK